MPETLPMEKPQNTESLIYEARARIMWGDSEYDVSDWLASQGVDSDRIEELMLACRKERDSAIRKRGITELVTGILIVVVAVVVGLSMLNISYGSGKGLGGAVVLGLYGLYKANNGLNWLYAGGKTRGSITDIGNSDF